MTSNEMLTFNKTGLEDAVKIAEKGTHCGMCKIDFLGSGLCPSGKKYGFAAYWPEGRMEIVKALHSKKIKPTETLVEIANSCTLCGICDKQCNFITHLRPEKVSKALKDYVNSLDKNDLQKIPEDDTDIEIPEEAESWRSILHHVLIHDLSPDAFERLSRRILRESGFIQVEVTGRSGDGGIDGKGIMRLSGLLSFHVIFQCKPKAAHRATNSTGRNAVRACDATYLFS